MQFHSTIMKQHYHLGLIRLSQLHDDLFLGGSLYLGIATKNWLLPLDLYIDLDYFNQVIGQNKNA